MKKFYLLAIAMTLVIACSLFVAPTAPPPEAPIATAPLPVATETPIPTDVPTPTLEPPPQPTALPTIGRLPQQWNGTYTYLTGEKQNITLLIEKVNGTTFTGKMIWQSFGRSRGAILKMNGEYVSDFGDEVEQSKWNNLEDYRSGDRSGAWLKWTETEIIDGENYTVNGWYYAHIREDGNMVAVYFFNKDETIADKGTFILRLVSP